MAEKDARNCKHASPFEPGFDDTHICVVDVEHHTVSCKTWQEALSDTRMINVNEYDCDGCEKWEAK